MGGMAVEIRRLFEMFDHNGDGKITLGELQHQLNCMGIFIPDHDLAHTIDQVDADGDRCIDRAEFQALYELIMTTQGSNNNSGSQNQDQGQDRSVQDEEEIKEAFNVFDKNHDGYISVEELRTVLSSLGIGAPRGRSLGLEDCRQMITKVDADGDGVVSFLEFKKMMLHGVSLGLC